MVYYYINNKQDLIKIIKIVMIKNKLKNGANMNYFFIKKIAQNKNLNSTINVLNKLGLKIFIKEN